MQVISLLGCVLILAGYAGLQSGRMQREDLVFNVVNVLGSAILLWVAVVDHRLGFIVLEGAWVFISVFAMRPRT
jgi:hypothetical protein